MILHSYGTNFAPFDAFTSGLREEMTRLSPRPLEYFEASLETARFVETSTEGPLAEYLNALFQETGIDLVITVGGPAARFAHARRERLFPNKPLLMTGLAARLVEDMGPIALATARTVSFDLPAVADNILRVLPETKEILVVLGQSSMGSFWVQETQRAFERFTDRVRFTWLHELSVRELEERVSVAGPGTAVFYGTVTVDGGGFPFESDQALQRLRAVSSAPIFGLFDIEVGRGVVGGPVTSIAEAISRATETALRILGGEAPEDIPSQPLAPRLYVYDFRELERWNIGEERLPAGSTVVFRPPSWIERYQELLLFGGVLFALETILVVGLLVQHARRRRAEEEAIALSRRLLTAHEDERGRLGRELHDDVSQRLVRLSMDAGHIEKLLEASPDGAFARTMREDASRLSDDVHALSYRLHPSVLHDLGLADALRTECELFSHREGLSTHVNVTDTPPGFEADGALCLFRIAQEALRNVARHANASRVNVSLERTDGGIQMALKDDGVGFDPERKRDCPSLGLASMRERIQLVHGRLAIESTPGSGTTVLAWVPEGAP